MSDREERWGISTDGSYFVADKLCGLEYHQKLNLLVFTSKTSGLLVYDTTSFTLLKKSHAAAKSLDQLSCRYIPEKDGLLIGDGKHLTLRKDLNGAYLLDTALVGKIQDPKACDVIRLEIKISDAEVLYNAVQTYELLRVDHMDSILADLKKAIDESLLGEEDSQKRASWSSLTLEYPQSVLLYVFQHIMMQLKTKGDNSLALPIAAALTERSGYYAPEFDIGSPVPLDRALMYSEAARLATFENWPHMNYQWAKPETMSRAGFYHEPTTSNDDRSMCFTCNVCLVCWEKTDEPWSEHERHQPNCPFIKGLPTQNVPLGVYYACQPAIDCSHSLLTTCKYGDDIFLAVSHEMSIKMYIMGRQLDLCRNFYIIPQPNVSSYPDTPVALESCSMSEIISAYQVTSLALITKDDERGGLTLVVGALYNQMVQLATYETGYMASSAGGVDIDPTIVASFSNPDDLAEAIYLEQRYLVTEPPADKSQKGVVVHCQAKRTQTLEIPVCFCYPDFEVRWMEQSIDRRYLIVYIVYKNLDNFPDHLGLRCGAIITYQVQDRNTSSPQLFSTATAMHRFDTPDECPVHISQLSQEFSSSRETADSPADEDIFYMLIVKRSGTISLMTVKQLKEVATFKQDSHKFLHTIYCSGIDRVCATTNKGEVVMLQLSPCLAPTSSVDATDSSAKSSPTQREIDKIFKPPLNVKELKQLCDLTETENLSGRFTATLPSCWSEVHQDQLQRKHPQHLQSISPASEAAFVTKTWKLQSENDTATREHMIELSLPKITSVGHVDVRFSLHTQAKEIPDVKVALLCYKIDQHKSRGKLASKLTDQSQGSILSQAFLDKQKLQLLCPSISLTWGGDASGQAGVVTLTSPALLQIKPRSLVVYMRFDLVAWKTEKNTPTVVTDIEAMLFPQIRNPKPGPSSPPRGPRGSMRGKALDLIDELSISIRKTKTTSLSSERIMRLELLDHLPTHKYLVQVACSGELTDTSESALVTKEQHMISALRVLSWIASLQSNDVSPRKYEETILKVVEEGMDSLVRQCLIKGSRSTGHSLTRMIICCTEVSHRMGDNEAVKRFSKVLLTSLLKHLDSLKDASSAGAVQSFLLLLSRVKCLDASLVCRKVCTMLLDLSKQYFKRCDDPDMARLANYGFTTSPYDTQLFDCTLPPFITKHMIIPEKAAATIVSPKQTQAQHIAEMYDDQMGGSLLVDLSDPDYHNLAAPEQFGARIAGLLEVEPLQFTIHSYSEYIHITHGSNASNVSPVFYGTGNPNAPDPSSLTLGFPINVPQAVSSKSKATLKMMDELYSNIYSSGLSPIPEGLGKLKAIHQGMTSVEDMMYTQSLFSANSFNWLPGSKGKSSKSSAASSSTTLPSSSKSSKSAAGVASASYPSIQTILQPPNEFTLIAGRISSGNARRYVVLDFGQPVRLTDVILPACTDLASFAVDVWLEGEILDSQRLVVCTDVFTKTLVLSDIQPACVCRYLKITYVPKNSGAGQTYYIPLGAFYGHAYVFPWECPSSVASLKTTEDVYRQIGVYTAAVEDVKSCYKLAAGRLKILLQNAEQQSIGMEQDEHPISLQIKQTHAECLKLQRQLNLATHAIRRLRSVLPGASEADDKLISQTPPCRDKLRFLIEASLAILISRSNGTLPNDLSTAVPSPVAMELFNQLCLHGNRRMQILTGNLIIQVCSGQDWYGNLFEQILREMFSSTNSIQFNKIKVFSLLVSMAQRSLSSGRKASHRVCGNSLQLLLDQLSPLTNDSDNLSGFVDMELVSWLLLFFAKLTDANYDLEESLLVNRWDFLSTESNITKRKVYHRFSSRQKARQERAQAAMRHRFTGGAPRQPKMSYGMPTGGKRKDKMAMMKKHMFMKREMDMLKFRKYGMDYYPDSKMRRRMAMMMGDPEAFMMDGLDSDHTNRVCVVLERHVVLPVVRALLCLLLNANFSCKSDMFILGCKVLSRLAMSTRPTLKLVEIATADQLRKLICNITHSRFNSHTQAWGGDWGKHATACLLEDLIEGEKAQLDVYDNPVDPEDAPAKVPATPSTSSSTAEPFSSPSSVQDMMMEGPHLIGPGGLRSIDLMKMMHRDELMMDDMLEMDMEMEMMFGADMEDVMEFMSGVRSEGPKPPADSTPIINYLESPMSAAIDSRLKYGCDSSSEVKLQLWIAHELFNQQKALSVQGPPPHTGVIVDNPTSSQPPTAEDADSSFSQNGNEEDTSEDLLGQTFSDLLCEERCGLDLESFLELYLDLNEECRNEPNAKEGFDPAVKPHIPLTPEAIKTLVTCVAEGQHLTMTGWTQLLRVLTVQLNSNLEDEDREFALGLCASDIFQTLLVRFLRSVNIVGPVPVRSFHELLTRIENVHNAAGARMETLADLILSTINKHLTDSYQRRTLDGALDVQCALIDFVGRLSTGPLSGPHVLSLFDCSVNIAKMVIDGQDSAATITDDTSDPDTTVVFPPAHKTTDIDEENGPQSKIPSKNQLVVSLLKMLSELLKRGVPIASHSMSVTDNSKLGGLPEGVESMDVGEVEGRQTDEQKRSEGSATLHQCLHLMDVDVEPTLADHVLCNRGMVSTLIQCLALCKSSTSSEKNRGKVVVTVGDGVFILLTTLFRCSTNYYQMLEMIQEHLSSGSIIVLSDPLRLFIKLVLNCEHTISRFIELDGINCLTSRFVESYKSSPDTGSSMISSVLQHITTIFKVKAPPSASMQGPLRATGSKNETLMNFAPLGNVYSSNPSVGPMYSLIQANQTHRRARTAPWSHKFTADQPWIDINIQLPCAVLVREVQIHPYLSSIHTAGPSHVSVELSHDGLPTLPAIQPILTSGLTCIKIGFLQAEVVSMVTLRLHRPKDSASIGLSQLCILGYPGLCEPGSMPQQTNSSLSWLQVLYHCIDHTSGVSSCVIDAVRDKLPLLRTCCSLLMSNVNPVVAAQLEKVIVELSHRSVDMSKIVIDLLLRQNHSGLVMMNVESMATDSTAEILSNICLHMDGHASERVRQLLHWLEDCAKCACGENPSAPPGVVKPSKLHVQCVASTLYTCTHMNIFDVSSLFSQQLFTHVFNWSMKLGKDVGLKRSVDGVMAAMCYIDITYYQSLLQKFFVSPLPASTQTEILRASVSDDAKDDIQQEMLTDESKGHFKFREDVLMDGGTLAVLATASQSPACAQLLIDSSLLRVLSQALTEFCLTHLRQCEDNSSHSPGSAIALTWTNLTAVLTFFSQCAAVSPMLKEWMAGPDGCLFWALLLELFSTNRIEGHSVESSAILFFKSVILNHPANQIVFSEVLCNLLRVIASTSVTGSSLSSFIKNLLLETVLEDEKMFVTVRNDGLNYRFTNHGELSSCSQLGVGVGHSNRTLLVSVDTTMEELSQAMAKPGLKRNIPVLTKACGGEKKLIAHAVGPDTPFPFGETADEISDILQSIGDAPISSSVPKSSKTDQSKIKGLSSRKLLFVHHQLSDRCLAPHVTVGEVVMALLGKGLAHGTEHIELQLYTGPQDQDTFSLSQQVSSPLRVFTGLGGLALLAEHLPMLYPEISQPHKGNGATKHMGAELTEQDYEYLTQVKGISLGFQFPPSISGDGKSDGSKRTATGPTTIPPHSLVAFGLFLKLPGYAEMLIKRRLSAKCLLRLVLGVRDDGEGVAILASSVASTLPTLPFTNLKMLYESSPLTTDDGLMLRRSSMEMGVLHLILACLAALSHHSPRKVTPSGGQHDQLTHMASMMASQVMGGKAKPKPSSSNSMKKEETSGPSYWAKGTGFGTGSTSTQWDLEQLLLKQQSEEEHVTCMLDIISAMVNPDDNLVLNVEPVLPANLFKQLADSCLLPAIASYLRNDSVLDMSRHVPLYKSVYRILRALASSQELVLLLCEKVTQSASDEVTLEYLASNMLKCVNTYKNRLRPSSSTQSRPADRRGNNTEDEDQANSLNELAEVLTSTHSLITTAVKTSKERRAALSPTSPHSSLGSAAMRGAKAVQTYDSVFKDLQFDSFKFLETTSGGAVKFLCHHHYELSVKQGSSAATGNNARTRRLAQEAVTLSTSLPLSASSSVFVRCDEDRMDVMKVLITGPSDTPYMNGCFEFDVFFPTDYPTSPPMINLQTTGNHKVRFNPNLYNDGKVCLSVLNTWHGRPEEKWNAQTSSFLQVLVSIQSLILVSEPYFNEPGYERSRGTSAGTANCREYDSNIRQATVKYAMLEMIKHPPACFKEVIQKHFWMKRKEIQDQIALWITDQEIASEQKAGAKAKTFQTITHNTSQLKKHFQQLQTELQHMKAPEGFTEDSVQRPSQEAAMDVEAATSTSSAPPITSPPSTVTADEMDDTLTDINPLGMMTSTIDNVTAGLIMGNDWQALHDMSSNSSDLMDIGEDMVHTAQEPSFDYEDYEDPSMFL